MKAGLTAVILLVLIGATATATAGASESDAEGTVTVWLYHESGAIWKSENVMAGTTLDEVLAGEYGPAKYWLDICTGYEWPKDRPIN
jgi:hypothetical protein